MSSSGTRWGRRLTATLALAVLALATGACGTEQAATFEDVPRQEIADLLRTRSEALSAGDVEGYLAPLSEAARAVEEPIAEGAVAMPIEDVRLTMGEVDVGGEGNTASGARVDFTFRYEGLPDDNVFFFRLVYDLAKVDGSWTVTSSTVGDQIFLPIWATGDVAVTESEHFLALHRPDMVNVDRILTEAEQARTELVEQLTLEPDDRHLLLLAKDGMELGGFLGLPDEEEYPAIAVAVYLFRGLYGLSEVPDNRMLIANVDLTFGEGADQFVDVQESDGAHGGEDRPGHDDPEFYDRITPRQVFRHELGHLALGRFTRESTPPWIVEGGAMMLSGESRIQVASAALENGVFDDYSFTWLSGESTLDSLDYAWIWAAGHHLMDEFGEQRFFEFYRDFKNYDKSVAHPLEDQWIDGTHRLLRRIYDLDERELDERTRTWIRRHPPDEWEQQQENSSATANTAG